jgi:hypothetical protein
VFWNSSTGDLIDYAAISAGFLLFGRLSSRTDQRSNRFVLALENSIEISSRRSLKLYVDSLVWTSIFSDTYS